MRILIDDAVKHIGTKAAIADLVGVEPQAVSKWVGPCMPPERARALVDKVPAMKQYVQPETEEPAHVE